MLVEVLGGGSAKEMLRSLLESGGYTVYPFGYEGSMSSTEEGAEGEGVREHTARPQDPLYAGLSRFGRWKTANGGGQVQEP